MRRNNHQLALPESRLWLSTSVSSLVRPPSAPRMGPAQNSRRAQTRTSRSRPSNHYMLLGKKAECFAALVSGTCLARRWLLQTLGPLSRGKNFALFQREERGRVPRCRPFFPPPRESCSSEILGQYSPARVRLLWTPERATKPNQLGYLKARFCRGKSARDC